MTLAGAAAVPSLPLQKEVGEDLHGPGIRVEAECGCSQRRSLPLRGVLHGIDTVRSMLNRRLNPDLAILSYRCGECKKIVYLTLRDLHLSS